jgi:hypothetical protein
MTTNAHLADHRSQAITLPEASHHNESWTLDELTFMVEFADDRDEDIALALGRSLYAVRAMRPHLADRFATATRARALSRRELVVTSFDEWERSFDV